jgi:hypothetical protein
MARRLPWHPLAVRLAALPGDGRTKLVLAGAAAVGLAIWVATVATAPRYSYGDQLDMGSMALWPLLAGAALALGFIEPSASRASTVALMAPPVVMAPWTAPRGDNDGLWVLIIPLLVGFAYVLTAVSAAGGRIRQRIRRRGGDRP